MSKKYEWPYYGINIPDGLIHSQTKTYDVYTEPCNNLDNCIINSHYTIPRRRCSPEKGIILPHHTRYNKSKGIVDRTFYFPNDIGSPNECDNMLNYTNKKDRPDKICDVKNNSCHIKMSRDDIPEIYTQIYEIVNELDKVFQLLKQICESSNEIQKQRLQKRIQIIILSYSIDRENILYSTSDTHLNLDIQSDSSKQTTRDYLNSINTKLSADKVEYSNIHEFIDYVKLFLKQKYNFLSYIIEFIINQPVNINEQIRNIDTIQNCLDDVDSPIEITKKSIFSVLSQSDDEETLSSPESVEAKGNSKSFSELELSVAKQKEPTLSDDQLLKETIKSTRDSIKKIIADIIKLNIDENFVFEYLKNESISIETLSRTGNQCEEILESISEYELKNKEDKPIISPSKKKKIINTRNFIGILEIYYGYPDYTSIVEKILNLNDNQLLFLEKNFYKFDKKFHLNFLLGTDKYNDFLRLIMMIRHHNFINIMCFLIITGIMITFINQLITNLINNKDCLFEVSHNMRNIISKIIPLFVSINYEENKFMLSANCIQILIFISNNICDLDVDITKLPYDPYDVLGLPMMESYSITIRTILEKTRQNRGNPLYTQVNDLIGTEPKKIIFDEKLKQHKIFVAMFCNGLCKIIIKIMNNILHSEYKYLGLYPFLINNLFLIAERYTNGLCYPKFKNMIIFYSTIVKNLKLIDDPNSEISNEQIFVNIKKYITDPHPFSQDINTDIASLVSFCNVIISKEQLNHSSISDPNWQQLVTQFKTHLEALKVS